MGIRNEKLEVSTPPWIPLGIQLADEMETKSRKEADGCVRMLSNQEVVDPPKAIWKCGQRGHWNVRNVADIEFCMNC